MTSKVGFGLLAAIAIPGLAPKLQKARNASRAKVFRQLPSSDRTAAMRNSALGDKTPRVLPRRAKYSPKENAWFCQSPDEKTRSHWRRKYARSFSRWKDA